jgi:hypothetical protein
MGAAGKQEEKNLLPRASCRRADPALRRCPSEHLTHGGGASRRGPSYPPSSIDVLRLRSEALSRLPNGWRMRGDKVARC